MKASNQTQKPLISGLVFLLSVFCVTMCKTGSSVCPNILHAPCALEMSEKRCREKYSGLREEGVEREDEAGI